MRRSTRLAKVPVGSTLRREIAREHSEIARARAAVAGQG